MTEDQEDTKVVEMKNLCILLIEPNKSHSSLIKNCLTGFCDGMRVDHASSHTAAYKKLKDKDYDLVLTEIKMNRVDFQKHIKKCVELVSDKPVIVLSSINEEKIIAQSVKAGAEDYIIKTKESLNALPKILNKVLNKKRAKPSKKTNVKEIEKSKLDQMLGTLNSLQKTLSRIKPSEVGAKSLDKISVENLYDQMNGLKKMVFSILKGK